MGGSKELSRLYGEERRQWLRLRVLEEEVRSHIQSMSADRLHMWDERKEQEGYQGFWPLQLEEWSLQCQDEESRNVGWKHQEFCFGDL